MDNGMIALGILLLIMVVGLGTFIFLEIQMRTQFRQAYTKLCKLKMEGPS